MRSSPRRTAGAAIAVIGLILSLLGILAPSVAAAPGDPGPPGNNGTVKIDGTGLNDGPGHSQKPNDPFDEGTDNDPHIECGIKVDFFNFDVGQRADITFTAHAPTGNNGVLYDENHLISEDGTAGAPNDVDEYYIFDVESDFDTSQFTDKHDVHGWHIKLNITVYDAEGKKVPGAQKHKVFWAEGCPPPPCDDSEETESTEDDCPPPPCDDSEETESTEDDCPPPPCDDSEETESTEDDCPPPPRCVQNCGPPPPPANLSADIECGDDGGQVVTVTNTGGTAALVDISSDDVVVANDLAVPALGSVQQLVAVAEDADYDIEVSGVDSFEGKSDCEPEAAVIPKVIDPPAPPAPVAPPVAVKGVVVTQPAQLPRTGNDVQPLLQVGLGLILLGAGFVFLGKGKTAVI